MRAIRWGTATEEAGLYSAMWWSLRPVSRVGGKVGSGGSLRLWVESLCMRLSPQLICPCGASTGDCKETCVTMAGLALGS